MNAPGAGPPLQTPGFELTVSVSPDARLVGAVRDVARYAAQAAGGDETAVETFGRLVEEAVRHSMRHDAATVLPVTFRCRHRVLEAHVDGRTLTLDV